VNAYRYDNTLDSDILAVAETPSGNVTLLTVPASAIYGKDYDIVLWREGDLHIAISTEYLNSVISKKVRNSTLASIVELCGAENYSFLDNPNLSAAVCNFAHNFFITELKAIVVDLIDATLSLSEEISFDESLSILIESDER